MSWDTQRQLGGSWAGENLGIGCGEGGRNRYPIPHVSGLWPAFTPPSSPPCRSPWGAAAAVPGTSSDPHPGTPGNSYFAVMRGLFAWLCASVQAPPPLRLPACFLCRGGAGGPSSPSGSEGCVSLYASHSRRPSFLFSLSAGAHCCRTPVAPSQVLV